MTSNKHCVYLAAIERTRRRSSTKPTIGHKAVFRLGGAGKEHDGLLIPTKVTMKTHPVLIDQGKPDKQVIGDTSSRHDFPEFTCFDYSWIVYS